MYHRVDGHNPNQPLARPGPNDAADLSKTRQDWQSAIISVRDAQARAASIPDESDARVNEAVANLSQADLHLIRQSIAEGRGAAEIAGSTGQRMETVNGASIRILGALGIQSSQDWRPVLGALVAQGKLSPQDGARAIVNLSASPGFGAAAPWQALIGQLRQAGLPAREVANVNWHMLCGEQSLSHDERRLLQELTGAAPARAPDEDILKTRATQASLANKLAMSQDAGSDRQAIVADAAWLGLLPPDSDLRIVDHACGRGTEPAVAAPHGTEPVPPASAPAAPPTPPISIAAVIETLRPTVPTFDGKPLSAEIIRSAPSLSAEEAEIFKRDRSEAPTDRRDRNAVFAQGRALGRRIGGLGDEVRLAIVAKAAFEGKFTGAELFAFQRDTAAGRLGLKPAAIALLEPLAAGTVPKPSSPRDGTEMATWSVTALARKLNVKGNVEKPHVRQAILDAAFTAGLLPQRMELPPAPPE